MSDKMLKAAKLIAERKGYDNLQDFIRETLREKLFGNTEELKGFNSYLATEASLAKSWMFKEEDKVWQHLQNSLCVY